MEKKLHRLETFTAQGSDGSVYTVHGYEHLARVESFVGAEEQWEPTGLVEYKLASGEPIEVHRDGRMVVAGSGLSLEREAAHS
jgi:hypothetical protein